MKFLFKKLTPFLVIGYLVLLIATPLGLFKLTGTPDQELEATYLLLLAGAALMVLGLDRWLVKRVPVIWLSIAEVLVLLVGGGYLAYDSRKTTLDLSAFDGPYFILVWVNDSAEARPLRRVFPFDKTLVVSDTPVVRLHQREFSVTQVRPPAKWQNGYSSRGLALTQPGVESAYFYGPQNHSFTPAQVDSLIRQALGR